ncbi:MAG: L,D-transpeptidase [Woeseia sp.]
MRRLFPVIVSLLCAAAQSDEARHMPAGILQVPDNVGTILIADTASATLRRFALRDGSLVETDARYMSIGRNGVGKERAWDRKTPLGVYFITEELDTERLHDKYGDKAFVLDYPNAWDRYQDRTGDGIWLHGVDRKDPDRPPLDTDGCLALPNEDITAIAGELAPLQTPVIVAREFTWSSQAEAAVLRAQLNEAMARWQQSVEQNDFFNYLALYAEGFRYRGMSRDDWAAWRSSVFAKRKPLHIEIKDLLLVADPGEPGLFLSRFTQQLSTAESTVVTLKRLYWRYDDAGQLRIVTEDNG